MNEREGEREKKRERERERARCHKEETMREIISVRYIAKRKGDDARSVVEENDAETKKNKKRKKETGNGRYRSARL